MGEVPDGFDVKVPLHAGPDPGREVFVSLLTHFETRGEPNSWHAETTFMPSELVEGEVDYGDGRSLEADFVERFAEECGR